MDPFFLQGFNPVISLSLAIFLLILSIMVAWWSYSYLKNISPLKKGTLVVLRASALSLLIFLLFNPYSSTEVPAEENRTIAVYLDNSQSLTVDRGAFQGEDSYFDLLETLEYEIEGSFEVSYFHFDNEIYPGNDLDLDGSATNLYQVYEHFRENENRYLASVILSDGIITRGRNPMFSVENLSKPVITIPLGDTTTVRDIAISTIDAPEKVYTLTTQTISVEISQQGFEGYDIEINVNRDNEFHTSGAIQFNADQSTHAFEFTTEFTESGLYTFDVSIPLLDEEFTHQNNRRNFSIEAVEDKTEIVSVAFEIHPDIASVRRLIASDQQYELISSTYLSRETVLGTRLEDLSTTPDLIVVHGMPDQPYSVLNWLTNTSAPLLFLALPSSFENRFWPEYLQEVLPYTMGEDSNLIQVQIDSFLSNESQHPILNISSAGLQRFPLLVTSNSDYTTSSLASVLLSSNYQGDTLSLPILVVEEAGAKRIAALNAINWFRFENNRSEETRDFFDAFFNNIISWTASSPDHENLVIEPARDTFNENESVQIRGTLVNELGNPEPDATIELQIYEQLSENPIRTFTMSHDQNGRYTTDAGSLPKGFYRAAGTAVLEERQLGSDQAVFSVGESVVEFLNTKRNDPLLSSLAEQSDGLFLDDHNIGRLIQFLNKRMDMEAESGISTQTDYFHRSYLWFVVILIFLSAEWLLRRNLSLP